MALQHLRSSTAHKRPIPTVMSAGQIAINTNEASPGLFFKDSNGDLVKVGPVHIGTSAPNSSPDSVAATALVTGTVYQILTVGTSDFTLVGASANTVGTVFTATGTTTGTGTVSGQQGNEKGEQWLDTTGGAYDLKIYDGTSWRSQAGEFVNVTGDTMTGALLLDNAASASAPDLSFDGDANTGIYSPGSDQFGITTAGTSRVVVDASGNVGIGTASPQSTFHLNTSSGSSTAQISSSTNTDGLQITARGDGTGCQLAAFGTSSDLRFFTTNSSNSTSEAFRIDSAGNVGIGTTSPNSSLVISASGQDGIEFIPQQTTATNQVLHYNRSTSAYSIVDTRAAQHLFRIAGTEAVRIDSSGNVGVGSTNPLGVLHTSLNATDGVGLYLENRADAGSSDAIGLDFLLRRAGGTQFGGTRIRGVKENAWTSTASTINSALTFSTFKSEVASEKMRIDSSGRLLVGTTSSRTGYNLQVEGTTGAASGASFIRNETGNSGGIITLGKSGGTANGSFAIVSNNDTLGSIIFTGADGSASKNAAFIQAEVDGTPGANDMPGRLVFSTNAGAPDTSPTERMRITSEGIIYHISANHGYHLGVTAAAGTTKYIFRGHRSATAGTFNSGTNVYTVWSNGNVQNTNNSYTGLSDIKLKENIVDASSQWDDIKDLRVRNYNFIEGQTHTQIGVVAQEVEAVSPGLVYESPDHDEEGNDLGTVTKSVNYSVLYMKAVKALQEAMERIETLEAKVAALEAA